MANETTVNRTFKSTVFIMVFEDKKNLLELYNAMTGKHYTDPEQLEIISQLYAGMTRNENLYGTKVVQIPPPEFVIFYNGEKDMPEETPLRLSDMYRIKVKDPKLQLEAVMLNISGSNNSRLKEAKAMSIFEYDQEKHIRQEREEAWEEGHAEGRTSGLKLAETIFRLFREGKTIDEISARCNFPADQIRELLGQEK